MSNWGVGDKALCIESGKVTREGAVYTVAEVHLPGEMLSGWHNSSLFPLLHFHELKYDPSWASDSRRFRKIRPDEPKACEAEFRILLQLSKRRAKA